VGWGLEVEVQRIADVQRQNLVALLNDFIGHASQVANGVANVIETLGGGDFAGLRDGHEKKF
jgi:hypothetical protein